MDFMDAVKDVPIEKVFKVLEEHFECIRLLYPKEYNSVIQKIRAS